ncbi:hypothetical protein LX32DRAFT_642815 [Colletotrichum zoysiae]|uniref:Uncharacterized protein n=1 Tax=Colletotrichum zoysiae TaxID=1216348 RepID=A0AAD9LY30_9PEZI|nr:hypothetical protein LX32DRAFT_642815 [Colletotrichum zoysiae]
MDRYCGRTNSLRGVASGVLQYSHRFALTRLIGITALCMSAIICVDTGIYGGEPIG